MSAPQMPRPNTNNRPEVRDTPGSRLPGTSTAPLFTTTKPPKK